MCAKDNQAGPGQARPCPFCGRTVGPRDPRCPRCKLALDDKSVHSIGRLMGPWFVLDEANPSAPGVSWEKFVALIQRGKVGPLSIVRGPATGGLWRVARDAPAVATQLGMCWSCHAALPDLDATRCDRCGAAANAPVHWPAQKAAPEDEDQEAQAAQDDQAMLELVQASAARARPVRRLLIQPGGRGNNTVSAILLFVIMAGSSALVVGSGIAVYQNYWQPSRARPADNGDPDRLRPDSSDKTRSPQPAGRAGDAPPDMYPNVRPYREPVRAPTTATAPPPPATRAAPAVETQPLDPARVQRLRAEMDALFEHARDAHDRGDLMKAQAILVDMLNKHDKSLWPEGAEAMLRDVQNQILASKQTGEEPPGDELARQRRAARDLFDRAQAAEKKGELSAAQDLLLKVLNEHHRKAWPEGAVDALRRVQDTMSRTPTTAPKFFGVEVKPK